MVKPAEVAIGGAVVAADAQVEEVEIIPPRVESTALRVAGIVRDNVKVTARKVKDWWTYEPDARPPRSVPDSYCYRTQGDVLCYRSPMPGWEHRLVGYQGTFAEPPPPPIMQPLPTAVVDESKLPANRVANAQPVFVEMPLEAKEEPKTAEDLQAPENVRETIEDPALAPQL